MSLKAFHIVFVTASVLLCLGFGAWNLVNYRESGARGDLGFAIGSLVATVALLVYGWYFLKKFKKISYL